MSEGKVLTLAMVVLVVVLAVVAYLVVAPHLGQLLNMPTGVLR